MGPEEFWRPQIHWGLVTAPSLPPQFDCKRLSALLQAVSLCAWHSSIIWSPSFLPGLCPTPDHYFSPSPIMFPPTHTLLSWSPFCQLAPHWSSAALRSGPQEGNCPMLAACLVTDHRLLPCIAWVGPWFVLGFECWAVEVPFLCQLQQVTPFVPAGLVPGGSGVITSYI